MFIPTCPTAVSLREIDVHKELLNPFEQLAFDFLVIVQVVVGSLMFVCLTHCSLLLSPVRDTGQ